MRRNVFLLALVSLAALTASADETPPSATSNAPGRWTPERFDREIAPLLARRCLDCHNATDRKGGLDLSSREGALAGGDSGPALDSAHLADSPLLARVVAGEMPPDAPLPADEKDTLRSWLADGAPWTEQPIDRFRFGSTRRAGYDWWSLVPLAAVVPPAVRDSAWPLGQLDHFILARLEAAGLAPSPPAAPTVLVRRLFFDLIGLPPTPEDVAAFTRDPSASAYAALVDRLLDSRAYAERWARHWLDIARFAESNGFEYDEPRRNAWPYRDWVIQALDNDLPYDQFCRLQLAGDALGADDPAAIAATGFLVAGPYDTPGQNQQSAAMRAVVRQDELEDLVGNVAQTFLGLTLNCARCHDHKFDPLRQEDYYRFASALSGVRQGDRDITSSAERAQHEAQRHRAQSEVVRLTAEIETIDAPVRRRLLDDRRAATFANSSPTADAPAANSSTAESSDSPASPQPLARWNFDDARDDTGRLELTLHGQARLANGALVLDGTDSYAESPLLAWNLQAKTLQVWVQLANLSQQGGAAISLLTRDDQVFDAIVFGEQEPGHWMAGSNGFVRTQSFRALPDLDAASRPVRVTLCYASDGTITAYLDGQPYGEAYSAGTPFAFAAGQYRVLFGLRHLPAGGNRLLAGVLLKAELYDHALTADEVAASGDDVSPREIIAQLDPITADRREQLAQQLAAAQAASRPAVPKLCHACVPRQPEPTHLLSRGDPRLEGEVVAPGGIAAVAPAADFALSPDAPEAERRLALARWITHRDNPLFARVIVNRLWHYHFGVGLVDTPNDFGFGGTLPSHTELLDWLAGALLAHDYHLKPLHRLIVTSRAYQQSAVARAEALQIDRENRLLWRHAPRRLEAEAVRDAMLAVCGRLEHVGGGPGFRDYEELNRSGTWTYRFADLTGLEVERRSIYRTVTRGGRGSLLDVFDCPDPSTTTPRRAVTTTPLQALGLWNNAFTLRASQALADRLEREVGADPHLQVARGFFLVYGRDTRDEELDASLALVRSHGLATLSRVLFNSNEFLYVD